MEGFETVVASLRTSGAYQVGSSNRGTVLIGDNDKPTVTLSATDADASEDGNRGAFTVTRTDSTASPLTVYYSLTGSASNDTDYNNLNGSVTISAGSSTAMIPIIPIDDSLLEGDETVVVNLIGNSGYLLGDDISGEVSIADNDAAPSNVVTNTNDSGAGSLRDAILWANSNPGRDTILFDIPGDGPHTISPASELPTITEAVVIDGWSQNGGTPPATPLIELSGSNAGDSDGLIITGSNVEVRGLAINNWSQGVGIEIFDARDNWIYSNLIGTNLDGTAASANKYGIWIGHSLNSGNNIIGTNGDGIADSIEGNLISGNTLQGIIFFSSSNIVAGNHIGTNLDGTAAIANGEDGIFIFRGGNNIIGTNGDGIADADERNLISGNSRHGVYINSSDGFHTIAGNRIGTNLEGTSAIGNGENGVQVFGSLNNIIGTDGDGLADAAEGNLISGNFKNGVSILGNSNIVAGNSIGSNQEGTAAISNGEHGVEIYDTALSHLNIVGGSKVEEGNIIAFNGGDGIVGGGHIQENSIFSNASLGIDLGDDGVTANDVGDTNNLQNFPELTSATSDTATTTIQGTLNSTGNTTFTLEFFANSTLDDSGYGEGETFLGSQEVTTGSDGNASFTASFSTSVPEGQFITATATDPDGNTSEFSQGVEVGDNESAELFTFSKKILAPDGAREDSFGESVAIDGNYALIGSQEDDDNGNNTGSAYLFNISSGDLLQKFTAPDGAPNGLFGESVAINGNYALIGSWSNNGGYRAFLFDVINGNLIQQLTVGYVNRYKFGESIALDGNHALIGSGNGSSYLFDITNGNLLRTIIDPNSANVPRFGSRFGSSVALDGNYALIGSKSDEDNGYSSGAAYLFDITNGDLVQKIIAPDGAIGDAFGYSVALDGDHALISSHLDDENWINSGSAYLFDISSGDLVQKFIAPDASRNGIFGFSVALNGNHALIGTHGDGENGASSGAAYLFDITSGDLIQKIIAPDGVSYDYLGSSVALDMNSVLIGSYGDDDNGESSGSAYLFTLEKAPEDPKVNEPFGKIGEEFQVNTYTSDNQWYPSVTSLSDGGFVVTWNSLVRSNGGYGIYAQHYDSNGNPVGSEFQVNTYNNSSQLYPSVTNLSDGGFVVTWSSSGQDGSGQGIYGQRYDRDKNPVGQEFQVNAYTQANQIYSSVTGLSDGGYVVTWTSNGQDGSGNGIYAQRYDGNGNPVGNEFQVNTYTSSQQENSSVASLSDGGFIVTWDSKYQDGSQTGIYAQRYDGNGNPVGNEFQVNTYTLNYQSHPSVAGLSNGGFIISWASNYGSGFKIYGQRYDSNGNAVGNEFKVNTYMDKIQVYPSVSSLSDGGFVVTWHSLNQDGSGFGIYGQRYDSNGNPVDDEFQVNTYTDDDQVHPSVASLPNGGFVVAWESEGQDSLSSEGIYGQLFG